ncbi:aldo/keto reductase-like protein [Mollisia scopiformis]|uniref:Aldo/keto reductase-like protein n=1 Tax=Mollisia scopiformis TaxID=149040 RepID=A0A194XBB4_MOLSC|nr:aldo/keto reductase-like protein [Mollisia scopiformis]KUJ17453.1 aldo/keto reductase-like protein [Mollisia scopiformis]
MAISQETPNGTHEPAKAAHVNMMTDTIIANLPPDGLRSILRSLLGVDAKVTPAFQSLAAKYLEATKPTSIPVLFTTRDSKPSLDFYEFQKRYRCLMGCGKGFESLRAISEVIQQVRKLDIDSTKLDDSSDHTFAVIDSDLVQAVTALQKQLSTSSGLRALSESEQCIIQDLRKANDGCDANFARSGHSPPFGRGSSTLRTLLTQDEKKEPNGMNVHRGSRPYQYKSSASNIETMALGEAIVPRMFMGLWQFSSPAWGSASWSNIQKDFRKHADAGFVAYDMADHYGDAERTFGAFRLLQDDAENIYCATKWCVFETTTISPGVVKGAITKRLTTLQSNRVELLQFHWQDYKDKQYVEAAKLIEQDSRVDGLGLCNFDTDHMDEIIETGVKVVSNQVQFSLIDLRPTFKMAESCRKHNVKLLTYGSLCGGLLADRWLGKPAPNLFDPEMTPSSRKYFEMITIWGGWKLFQELLTILSTIGKKHKVSISVVAVRWVLEHEYVGAVIVGVRMGISEHVEENLKAFTFKLDEEDLGEVQKVLDKSKARDVFEAMGDCGSEYR